MTHPTIWDPNVHPHRFYIGTDIVTSGGENHVLSVGLIAPDGARQVFSLTATPHTGVFLQNLVDEGKFKDNVLVRSTITRYMTAWSKYHPVGVMHTLLSDPIALKEAVAEWIQGRRCDDEIEFWSPDGRENMWVASMLTHNTDITLTDNSGLLVGCASDRAKALVGYDNVLALEFYETYGGDYVLHPIGAAEEAKALMDHGEGHARRTSRS